jgi:hypothetical protein
MSSSIDKLLAHRMQPKHKREAKEAENKAQAVELHRMGVETSNEYLDVAQQYAAEIDRLSAKKGKVKNANQIAMLNERIRRQKGAVTKVDSIWK